MMTPSPLAFSTHKFRLHSKYIIIYVLKNKKTLSMLQSDLFRIKTIFNTSCDVSKIGEQMETF